MSAYDHRPVNLVGDLEIRLAGPGHRSLRATTVGEPLDLDFPFNDVDETGPGMRVPGSGAGSVAQEIADEIQSNLGHPKPPASAQPARTAHEYEAYDLYLKGQYFLNKRTIPGLEAAIGYFQRATARDPAYARAHAALADSYALLAGYSAHPPKQLMSKARAAALKALELDQGSPKDEALVWLERAYAEHSGLTGLKVNPAYDALRSDPRFQSLLRRVGLTP